MDAKWKKLPVLLGLALAFGAACATDTPDAPETTTAELGTPRYHVFTLPSLGGTRSFGNSLNDVGWAVGQSYGPGNASSQAVLWFFGFKLPLGTLGGPNSAVLWPVKNIIGVISGIAETNEDDPYGEDWSCSAFFPTSTGKVCRGFVWERGHMRELPTFGGTHGFATGTNNFGQTVGWAENRVEDDTCNAPQRFQFRAALWDRDGRIHELPPLATDRTSAATALNDRGQVVGISGACSNAVGEYSAAHAVLWEHGVPRDLGDLGGKAWNTPMAINQQGVVVGFANAPDTEPENDFNVRAFRWTAATGIEPLGSLGDGETSQALGVNEAGRIVGVSCGARCRAFIHEGGQMRNLNDFVTLPEGDYLRIAGDINNFGMITGQYARASGERVAFVAIPIGR